MTAVGLNAGALCNLANMRVRQGDLDGAISAYSQALVLEPANVGACNNLGTALIRSGQPDAAIPILERALALQPGYLRALTNLGKALRETGRAEDAVARLREALDIEPNYGPALVNLGDALAANGDFELSEQVLERAIGFAPGLAEAHMALGIARLQRGRVTEALTALHKAIALSPAHPDAHSNLAHALFMTGNWQAAWPHFEYRFHRTAHRAQIHVPGRLSRWDGALAEGQELWLVGEQGLGDQLQFARYANELSACGIRCVIACDPRIVKVLDCGTLQADIVALGTWAHQPSAYWLPLLSAPAWHRTRMDNVPGAKRYLSADPARVATWKSRLKPLQGLRVAIAWAGNPKMETGRYVGRSPPLAALAPLADLPGVNLISLQKDAGEQQLDTVPFARSIFRIPDLDTGADAFVDTAAILECVDLLITSDTAIAHLAGALGVPVWLCLMQEPDWRWMREGSRTPWYSSMRIFRQPTPGDWISVYAEVAAALAPEFAGRREARNAR